MFLSVLIILGYILVGAIISLFVEMDDPCVISRMDQIKRIGTTVFLWLPIVIAVLVIAAIGAVEEGVNKWRSG